MTPKLILASSSPFRRMLMQNAGLAFEAHAARIDERAVEAPLERAGVRPDAVALVLARAKAEEVSSRFPDSLVIGSDQTMSLGDRVFHKPKDMADAASHLQALSGVTHRLNSAVAIVSDGVVLWEHLAHAELTMRPLTAEFIARHLARVGEKALSSVGAYQLEGQGIQLFEKIEGDYFTILGLPMLPLLKKLRELGAIDG
ncbi:Maf-like protein [Rhizobium leguminosarum]|jgi:septum formation protein|uniref:7-methyl-GTP pyrophosphatase n=2 Tax=Rhizobium leguminosarum TaxID=384 RepID=A0A1B8R553_RHILT|nr:Maf-like protein [Rhizobium leguminosarum]AOO93321.1 septum formation inhibitor Maf [Rhizobium leguminosarum bv. trifolii]AXA40562.1 septum formation protein Maf [Rhizobium leguminosarum]MBY5914043.1 Maf-like protein [Rhizobium leguminosarum]NKK90532.1 Maf-like protein [Rhizobium leguminosarum bv. viciae]OBY03939.1 septum formation protein Maf [Rhizobium leguminosarum bv. trifolii]